MFFSFELEQWQLESIRTIIDYEQGDSNFNVICQITKHPGNNNIYIVTGGIVPEGSCEPELEAIRKRML